MNKTIKTIAWICVVLGLLGTAADGFMIARVWSWKNDTQARLMDIDVDEVEQRLEDADLEKIFPHSEWGEEEIRERFEEFRQQKGDESVKRAVARFAKNRMPGRFDNRVMRHASHAVRPSFPFAAIALGPVLLVAGTVTLIVNREPTAPQKSKENGDKVQNKKQKSKGNK